MLQGVPALQNRENCPLWSHVLIQGLCVSDLLLFPMEAELLGAWFASQNFWIQQLRESQKHLHFHKICEKVTEGRTDPENASTGGGASWGAAEIWLLLCGVLFSPEGLLGEN